MLELLRKTPAKRYNGNAWTRQTALTTFLESNYSLSKNVYKTHKKGFEWWAHFTWNVKVIMFIRLEGIFSLLYISKTMLRSQSKHPKDLPIVALDHAISFISFGFVFKLSLNCFSPIWSVPLSQLPRAVFIFLLVTGTTSHKFLDALYSNHLFR